MSFVINRYANKCAALTHKWWWQFIVSILSFWSWEICNVFLKSRTSLCIQNSVKSIRHVSTDNFHGSSHMIQFLRLLHKITISGLKPSHHGLYFRTWLLLWKFLLIKRTQKWSRASAAFTETRTIITVEIPDFTSESSLLGNFKSTGLRPSPCWLQREMNAINQATPKRNFEFAALVANYLLNYAGKHNTITKSRRNH